MRVLVTGGAGFIGSHIVDKLIKNHHETAIIDNLSHGSIKNINSKAVFFNYDIRDKAISKIFKEFRPEVLCHHAAQIKVPASLTNPLMDADINILGTINLLENCREYGVKKIIYPASAAIFGEPKYLPIDETHPLNMVSNYGVSKHTVEHYLQVYKELFGINYTVFRYSNVYGPRQDCLGEGGVIAIFSEKLLKDEVSKIYGSGEQTRDFLYVEDAADANILALCGLNNDVFNVSSNIKVSINSVFNQLKILTKKEIEPEYFAQRHGDIIHSCMTYNKIHKACGWKPKVTLEEGLKRTLDYYRK